MCENPMLESIVLEGQDTSNQSELEATFQVAAAVAEAVREAVLRLRETEDEVVVRGVVSGALQGAISGLLALAANPADPTGCFREPQAAYDEMTELVGESEEWIATVMGYWDAVAAGCWGRVAERERQPDEEPLQEPEGVIAAMVARGRQRYLDDDM